MNVVTLRRQVTRRSTRFWTTDILPGEKEYLRRTRAIVIGLPFKDEPTTQVRESKTTKAIVSVG
jgi:3'-phosphoadenosine 5'-phosphosulfate (PAPS) 3'-phosphatase